MLIARSILAKLRPARLSPREIQDQLDVTRTAVLTAAYANARREQPAGAVDKSYGQIEKEIAALKPLAVKKRAQMSLNDQVVADRTIDGGFMLGAAVGLAVVKSTAACSSWNIVLPTIRCVSLTVHDKCGIMLVCTPCCVAHDHHRQQSTSAAKKWATQRRYLLASFG